MSNRIKIRRKKDDHTKEIHFFQYDRDMLNQQILTLGKVMLEAFEPICKEIRKSYIFQN